MPGSLIGWTWGAGLSDWLDLGCRALRLTGLTMPVSLVSVEYPRVGVPPQRRPGSQPPSPTLTAESSEQPKNGLFID